MDDAVNLDTLVSVGQRPWRPAVAAGDVDVWDRFDFPACGTYRLGRDLIVFALITTAGGRSLWAYVPVPAGRVAAGTGARFDSDAEFDAFVTGFFSGREAVFAVAQDFVITAKSDGVLIGAGPHSLLAAAAEWYITRVSSLLNRSSETSPEADAAELLHAAQGALASALA